MMLQLNGYCIDVVNVGKLLMGYKLPFIASPTEIIVNGDIPLKALYELLQMIHVTEVRNYQVIDSQDDLNPNEDGYNESMSIPVDIPAENESKEQQGEQNSGISENTSAQSEPNETEERTEKSRAEIALIQERKDEAKGKREFVPEHLERGQIYKWGEIRENENSDCSIKECVIILQGDHINPASNDTIAMLCTSEYAKESPLRFSFQLGQVFMDDYSVNTLRVYNNRTMFVRQIIGVNQNQLGRYLGTMNSRFMSKLQISIDYCLELKHSRNINRVQLEILAKVDISKLLEIIDSNEYDGKKVNAILELFGFDTTLKGIDYVRKAILKAKNMTVFGLEHLAIAISKEENVDEEEVKRLIVARTKENFGMQASPAISFITLISSLLKKG